jgi:hypothetical protein
MRINAFVAYMLQICCAGIAVHAKGACMMQYVFGWLKCFAKWVCYGHRVQARLPNWCIL